jgi:hypothetical protein
LKTPRRSRRRSKERPLSLRDDSAVRIGWSKNIEHSREQHARDYNKRLVATIGKFLEEQGCGHWVVGCLSDLWHELTLQLSPTLQAASAGHFHLENFAIVPWTVLQGSQTSV